MPETMHLHPKYGSRAVYRSVDKAWTCRQGCPMYLQKELLIYRKTRMNKKKENFNKKS